MGAILGPYPLLTSKGITEVFSMEKLSCFAEVPKYSHLVTG